MKHQKWFVATGLISVLMAFVLMWPKVAQTVTDTCTGVETAFEAVFPNSVTPNGSLTISNITSKPATSYGVTVNSSRLELSATNTSQTTYAQNNTSTDPSPTTGANTYTAYYPNWDLTASGTAGSTITIKLVKATANVDGIGDITCNLSATLATIPITEPASSNNSNNSPTSTSQSSTSSSATTSTPEETDDSTTEATPSESTEQTTTTESSPSAKSSQATTGNVTIFVKDTQQKPLKGAHVELDKNISRHTSSEGVVSFEEVALGDHTLSVSYEKQTIERRIIVGKGNDNQTTVLVPGKSKQIDVAFFTGMAVIAGLSVLPLRLVWRML